MVEIGQAQYHFFISKHKTQIFNTRVILIFQHHYMHIEHDLNI